MKPDDENYTDARDQQRIEEAIRTIGSHRLKTDETYAVDSMCVTSFSPNSPGAQAELCACIQL